MSELGNKEVFAKNLQRYMENYSIDRKGLAQITGKPYSTVNDWFNAKTYPRIDAIEKMARYFHIDKADLIENRTNPMSPKKAYLMDRIAKADDKQIEKIRRLMDFIDEEDSNG